MKAGEKRTRNREPDFSLYQGRLLSIGHVNLLQLPRERRQGSNTDGEYHFPLREYRPHLRRWCRSREKLPMATTKRHGGRVQFVCIVVLIPPSLMVPVPGRYDLVSSCIDQQTQTEGLICQHSNTDPISVDGATLTLPVRL